MPTPYDEYELELRSPITRAWCPKTKSYVKRDCPDEVIITTGKEFLRQNSDTHYLVIPELRDLQVGDVKLIGGGAAATTFLRRLK